MPKKPSQPLSQRRLAANRANAAKSTGPRTPEGKAASSQNAVKHGFRSSVFAVVRLEELDEISRLKADAVSCYRPVNAQELIAVERIALAQQMMFRAARLEAGLFTDALNEAIDPREGLPVQPMMPLLVGDGDIEITRRQNRNYFLAEGFRMMVEQSDVWRAFLRYQSQAERLYRRATEDFARLKTLRDEFPNEPNALNQPEDNEPLPPLEEINSVCRRVPDSPAAAPKSSLPPSGAGVSAPNPAAAPANPSQPGAIKPAA